MPKARPWSRGCAAEAISLGAVTVTPTNPKPSMKRATRIQALPLTSPPIRLPTPRKATPASISRRGPARSESSPTATATAAPIA